VTTPHVASAAGPAERARVQARDTARRSTPVSSRRPGT